MPHIRKLHLCDNNITSVGVMRKAAWQALRTLDLMENNFRDCKSLAWGCFPQLRQLSMYCSWGEDKNTFTEQCFPAKMQAPALSEIWIQKGKYSCDRSITRAIQQRCPQIKIN